MEPADKRRKLGLGDAMVRELLHTGRVSIRGLSQILTSLAGKLDVPIGAVSEKA